MFAMSAREFNQSVGKAQRIAQEEPVLVTRRGEPAYVLLSIAEYERLAQSEGGETSGSLLDAIEPLPEDADPEDLFGQIMAEIQGERRSDVGRESEP